MRRLFLLPISTHRSLIYYDRTFQRAPSRPSLSDRLTAKVASTWESWERPSAAGWKQRVTTWGNGLLRRIPFEEWGLKTIPPLGGARRRAIERELRRVRIKQEEEEKRAKSGSAGEKEKAKNPRDLVGIMDTTPAPTVLDPLQVLYPSRFFAMGEREMDKGEMVRRTLMRLATERQGLHRRRMVGSLIAAPLTLPCALVPVIPNIPGFYLLFRAWSHWRALSGCRHLEFMVEKDLIKPIGRRDMDHVYATGLEVAASASASGTAEAAEAEAAELVWGKQGVGRVAEGIKADEDEAGAGQKREVMLLGKSSGKVLAGMFGLSDMAVEIERAVEQVETSIDRGRR